MSLILIIVATLAALEQLYIMYLETCKTSSVSTQKAFHLSEESLKDKTIANLFKNQGVYNGLIAIFLVYGLFISQNSEIVALFLIYIIVVASYGAMTVDKKIFLKQGGLAILALISMFF